MKKQMWKMISWMIIFFSLLVFGCGGGGGGGSSNCGVIDGSGEAAIWFVYVPPYGSYENIQGRVSHISSESYNVAVYIKVGGWWTKPYWAQPVTDIECNGNFITDITTGGIDESATEIRAYLIPAGYDPPLAYGGSLPVEVGTKAVAVAVAYR